MQVGTYPTRNFATLGPSKLLLDRLTSIGPGHFCLALHVAMQIGLYHHTVLSTEHFVLCVWRIVSEDSCALNERQSFLLIACTERIVTAPGGASTVGSSGVPANSQILQLRGVHSYGRRLSELRSRASPCG
jgi:hypothetical protein